jgi:hypothetical protein
MIVLAYRHGLRATELVNLRRDAVNFAAGVLHVTRLKNGDASTQPLQGDTLRALRRLFREAPASPFVFLSERGAPFTRAGFQKMVVRATTASSSMPAICPATSLLVTTWSPANLGWPGFCHKLLVLERLRDIRGMLARVLEDTADLKLRVGMLEAGYASMSLRLDRIDNRLERVEQRLGLIDPAIAG